MMLDGILSRDAQKDIIESYRTSISYEEDHEEELWHHNTHGPSSYHGGVDFADSFDDGPEEERKRRGKAEKIDEMTDDASSTWADVLGVAPDRVRSRSLVMDSNRPHPHYPVQMVFDVADEAFGDLSGVRHRVRYDARENEMLDMDEPAYEADRRHQVTFSGTDSATFTKALAHLHGYCPEDDRLELDDAALRRITFTGEEIVGGDKAVEYIEPGR